MSLGERWQDEAWAAAQLCSRSDRLSVTQIAAIRELAITINQVKLLSGQGRVISRSSASYLVRPMLV